MKADGEPTEANLYDAYGNFDDTENGLADAGDNPNGEMETVEQIIEIKPAIPSGHRKRKRARPAKKRARPALAKRFKCDQCPYANAYKRAVEKHAQIHAEKAFECENCKRRFACVEYLRKHMKTVHKIILL